MPKGWSSGRNRAITDVTAIAIPQKAGISGISANSEIWLAARERTRQGRELGNYSTLVVTDKRLVFGRVVALLRHHAVGG